MAEVSRFYPGDLSSALDRALTWMLGRQNPNVSPFAGNAVTTPTTHAFAQGSVSKIGGTFDELAQERWPNVVLDPIFGAQPDEQTGPDGFPINYSPIPLLSGNLLYNVLSITQTQGVSGRVFNLLQPRSGYRVDVYSRREVFYYQGSSPISEYDTWQVAAVGAGTVIAFLMPAFSQAPQPGSSTPIVTGWIAHSNMGVGPRLADYFVRLYTKGGQPQLLEDNIPIILQDPLHGRFGASVPLASGTPVAYIMYDHPELGAVALYSTAQATAVYPELPRTSEVPPGDPDFVDPDLMANSNLPHMQNRCSIQEAALAIIAFAEAGLWEPARKTIARLNALRESGGYLPTTILENAEDQSSTRWTLISGQGAVANVFDASEPPAQSGGSRVISFTATSGPASWSFTGAGLPTGSNSIIEWRYKTDVAFQFLVGVTSSTAKVSTILFASSGTSGYNAGTKTITVVVGLHLATWRLIREDLNALIGRYLTGETLTGIAAFRVSLTSSGNLRLDNLSTGTPQPSGSLALSYDVYNGQSDQAVIRAGAMAWMCYAYGFYLERTGDFETAALALEAMLALLFSLQVSSADLRNHLIMIGWGQYEDPGYRYVPGQISSVSTADNIVCYFAFEKAARVLPTAAQNLLNAGRISQQQYESLKSTAAAAGTKASQIYTAIVNQLWIPASGQVKGHFAQGASTEGLDTSLQLTAAGAWAALLCHDAYTDARAVECLEFIYETFFLNNQQILKSSDANRYNQEYEQLTPFDGFKPYADSAGGHSGSPLSVSMEGTWSALAAYLRLIDDSGLRAYFQGYYAGGLEEFVTRLVQSLKIVGATTSDRGVLAYSLADRALPWEFSVRKTVAASAWFWLTCTRNDVVFSSLPPPLAGRPYLKTPQGVQQTIRQLEGQSSIGALELELTDRAGFLTALASQGKLEGRKVTLNVGYPGMVWADFTTLATQQIESVEALANTTGYLMQCRDPLRFGKTKIFTSGDDGYPVSRDHPRTLLANPIDIALMVFQNEIGLGQTPCLPKSGWKLYDPKRWDSTQTSNPTLIVPNPHLDLDTFLAYRSGIFAGSLMDFQLPQPVEAKQFLEYELFRTLGGYLVVLADGRFSPRFFLPPPSFSNLFAFNERNVTVLPELKRHPVINQVTFRLDYDGSQFQRELLFLCSPSLQHYGLAGQHIVESKGLKTAWGGAALGALTATRIFRRYGGIDPVTQAPNGGAPILTVVSHFLTLTVEVGDYVFVSHRLLPSFETGRRGLFNRVFEVIEKQPDFSAGTMTYRLLDAGWMARKKLSRLAPQGTPAYPAASEAARARYMFICQNATGAYSDGTAGKTIF